MSSYPVPLRNDEMSAEDNKQMIYNWADIARNTSISIRFTPTGRRGGLIRRQVETHGLVHRRYLRRHRRNERKHCDSRLWHDPTYDPLGVAEKSSETKTPIRAVVVTEHRGLNLDARGWAAQAEGVLVVMVYSTPFGCISKLISPQDKWIPPMATREFLNLLARTKPADKAPFIYVSDHDANGWGIPRTLRYGSEKEAWLSVSQCIPKLEWWG